MFQSGSLNQTESSQLVLVDNPASLESIKIRRHITYGNYKNGSLKVASTNLRLFSANPPI